jgi:hypothetical protein
MPSWREIAPLPVTGHDEATRFVEELGFATWGPIPKLDFPNVAEAMGENAWSVMDHTWYWKDDVHIDKQLYYAKLFRGQPSFITPEFLPDFIAALGETERDVFRLHIDGKLLSEARAIVDWLTDHPGARSAELRKHSGAVGKGATAVFDRALIELQRRFIICKSDLAGRGRGLYGYLWDLAERFWPEPFADARRTSVTAARANIRARLGDFGIESNPRLEEKLFLWLPM